MKAVFLDFGTMGADDLDPSPTAFRHPRPSGDAYYLVVEELPGGGPGPSGRYGY